MIKIHTASWLTKLPKGTLAVSTSRSAPRGKSGYRSLSQLKPGPWFRSVTPVRFLHLYSEILSNLDPQETVTQLAALSSAPVLLCWESAEDCHSGKHWCHRHLCAQWLEDRLGITVEEIGYPKLHRFALLQKNGIPLPDFRLRKRRRNIDRKKASKLISESLDGNERGTKPVYTSVYTRVPVSPSCI